MSKDKAKAGVGQDTRRNGRMEIDRQVELLKAEREQLVIEKKRLDVELARLQSWKLEATSKGLRKNDKDGNVKKTLDLESEYRKKRAPLLREKHAIEERLHDIKRQFAKTGDVREDVKVLLRIEEILLDIAGMLDKKLP